MDYQQSINLNYHQDNLVTVIQQALEESGKAVASLTRDDLRFFDEFHIGGRAATRELARLARLAPGTRLLDIGCGIGGPARTLAAEFGCQVTGVELVESYYQAAVALTEWVGMSAQVQFRLGSAEALPFEDGSFDALWSQHLIMNIADKPALFREMRRVLRPGGQVALYEGFAGPLSPPYYPVPWAAGPSISFLTGQDLLRQMLADAGFQEEQWRDVTGSSLDWFQQMIDRQTARRAASGPSLLGLHLLLGPTARLRMDNVRRNLAENRLTIAQAILRG